MNVVIYQSELEYLSRYTLDYPNIETGGHLFGFWQDDGIPVVTFVLGPGDKSEHSFFAFRPDVDYLERMAKALTNFHGLKHIGEWHSHHTLGLSHPSQGDADNVLCYVNESGFCQFLLCIATCSNNESSVTPYLFLKSEKNYLEARWSVIKGASPMRFKIEQTENVLLPKNQTSNYKVIADDYVGDLVIPESIIKTEIYWFSDKNNHIVLKRIIDEIIRLGADTCRPLMNDYGHVCLEITDNKHTINVLFPDGFPVNKPIVNCTPSKDSSICEWNFDGDIYDSFIKYYKQI